VTRRPFSCLERTWANLGQGIPCREVLQALRLSPLRCPPLRVAKVWATGQQHRLSRLLLVHGDFDADLATIRSHRTLLFKSKVFSSPKRSSDLTNYASPAPAWHFGEAQSSHWKGVQEIPGNDSISRINSVWRRVPVLASTCFKWKRAVSSVVSLNLCFVLQLIADFDEPQHDSDADQASSTEAVAGLAGGLELAAHRGNSMFQKLEFGTPELCHASRRVEAAAELEMT
jgi:hypothetical protein